MKVSFNRFVLILTLSFAFNTVHVAESQEKAEEVATSQALSLTETYTLTNTLPKQLVDLRKQVNELADTNALFLQIQKLKSKVEDIEWETTTAATNPNLNSHELFSLDTKLTKVDKRIAKLNRLIESNIHALEILSNEWIANDLKLQKFKVQTATQTNLTDALPAIESLEQIIKNAQQFIENQIHPTLLAGKKIGDIQARIYTLNDTVSDLLQDTSDFGFQQTAPSILSTGFYNRFKLKILKQSWENIRLFGTYQKGYLRSNFIGVLTFLAVITLVAFLTWKSRPLVKASHRWHHFIDKPLITGVFIVSTTFVFIEAIYADISLPPNWQMLLQIPMIIAAVFLAGPLFNTAPLYRTISSFLIFSLTVIMFFNAINLPQHSFIFAY